jgi:hypothetical protein
MDKLEDYIRKNREALDRYNPPLGLWKRILKGSNKEKPSLAKWISIAAMIAVIMASSIILFRSGHDVSVKSIESNIETGQTLINSQLMETEAYYNSLANSIYREASPLLIRNPEIGEELSNDILQLDSICSDIKNDLKDNVANQDVIEALIQNYRIKIRLLEDMLTLLKENEDNPEKNNNHEL